METVDTLILGAGAAGMMCAGEATARGARVLAVDHAKAPGEKIRISGGGRCNFTNLHCTPENFLGENRHFCKSALSRYTQWDFIDLVARHGIAWHEKTLGQLFCDSSARDIIALLRAEMRGAELWLQTEIDEIAHRDGRFIVRLTREGRETSVDADNLVIATGGKSIPKMGATGLAYRIAQQFDHEVTETRPALVPLTFTGDTLEEMRALAGVAVTGAASCDGARFEEGLLFTHRGLSGPSILQISSFWRDGRPITVALTNVDVLGDLKAARASAGRRAVGTVLAGIVPKRLAETVVARLGLSGNLADASDATLGEIVEALIAWQLWPTGTEGYRTAEVTLGGVSTDGVDARTMESRRVPGLYFIGEAMDVTGWLGGYNFQWAWSSGWAAGSAIAERG